VLNKKKHILSNLSLANVLALSTQQLYWIKYHRADSWLMRLADGL
jgi:hypothetical protein